MISSSETVPTTSILENYVAVLKKYNDFNSRARRSEYWDYVMVNVVVAQVLNLINGLLFDGATLMGGLMVVLTLHLVTLLPSLAVSVRRMHDLGKSGWFALIPFYNLILACREGEKGINQYGSDPKRVLKVQNSNLWIY
ncbi:DUF805 domain-containing protein [Spirosoma flavus]